MNHGKIIIFALLSIVVLICLMSSSHAEGTNPRIYQGPRGGAFRKSPMYGGRHSFKGYGGYRGSVRLHGRFQRSIEPELQLATHYI